MFFTYNFYEKKIILASIIILCVFTSIFAKPSKNSGVSAPEWVINYRTEYPLKNYIAQLGQGETLDAAKTDAIASLGRYFQTTVNTNLKSTFAAIDLGDDVAIEKRLYDEKNISTQIDLFGIQTNQGFFEKKSKTWYCVAFIDREDAWFIYKPIIDAKKTAFYGFYNRGLKEKEPFVRRGYFVAAKESSIEFLEALEFGRLINPAEEETYSKDRDVVAEIPSLIYEEENNCVIELVVTDDYGDIITNAISSVFAANGLKCAMGGSYKANVVINPNIVGDVNGEEPIAVYPSLSLELVGVTGKSVFSYMSKVTSKTVKYDLNLAKKNAYPKLAEQIKGELPDALQKFLSSAK